MPEPKNSKYTMPMVNTNELGLEDPSRPQLAMEILKREMPKEVESAKARPMYGWEKFMLGPGTQAVTYPWNTVAYNPEMLPKDQSELNDVLAHELVHVRQNNRNSWLGVIKELFNAPPEYLDRPYEQEAFDYENKRKAARRDIPLPRNGQ